MSSGASVVGWISRVDFETAVGPLGRLMRAEQARAADPSMQLCSRITPCAERLNEIRNLKTVQKEQEALTRTDIEMFADLKLVLPFDQGQYLLGRHRNGTIYSLKAVSKSIAAKNNQQKMILQEKRMAEMLHVAGRFVPLVLHTFVSPGYLFSVYKVQLVTDLNALMTDPFDEPTAAFYGGCMALAINYLHGEQIIYRSICPESVFINSSGVPQLVDFRNAVRDNGMPLTDICGIEQYLAPEQVGGHGHSLPVDLWALGVLIYEMRCGATPWATGDPKKDTEVGARTQHLRSDRQIGRS
eukprot:7080255-Prymnesium_polylepis.2